MTISRAAVLAAELHCLSEDGTQVITMQHWTDPSAPADRPRAWLRPLRNGARVTRGGRTVPDGRYSGRARQVELAAELRRIEDRFAATALGEDEVWSALRRLAGVERQSCPRCSAGLVLAWPFCPACGADGAAGAGRLPVRGRMLPQPVRFSTIGK